MRTKVMNEQPKIEQILFRMAVDHLTARQRRIWELWNYDRLTQDQIAIKLKMKQSNVSQRLLSIEKRLKKWCKLNKGAYLLLKLEQKIMNEGDKEC